MIALMIGAEVHHYNILSQLGGGGMGVVYRAEDSRLGRTVALKFLPDSVAGDTQVLERFEREARAASRLNHPHICTVFDIGQWENRRFIVMELLEGRNVGEAVRQGALDIDDLIEIAIQLADALDAAHSEGIVHRDIKPANIMMSPRGHATLLDFGLAKQVGASTVPISDSTMSGEVTLTKPGSTLGTIAYMSPEQVRGEAVDERSDLFSFGAVLYEAATGVPAFAGHTAGLTFDAVLNRQPPPVRDLNPKVPQGLATLIERALEKDRDKRYQSAAEMRADLKRIRSGTFASMRVPPEAAIPQFLEAPAVNDSTSTVGNTFGNNAAAGTGVVDLRRPPRPMTPHLNAVSWILMAWGWFRALWGLAGWLVDSLFDVVPGFFLNAGPWPILSGLGILLTGYYLKRRSRRARFAAFILAFFLIGLPPFGWALAGYMGWVLLSANGRRMFPPNSPPAAV